MALITCPECNKQISDKANACPNCGLPIAITIQENTLHFPALPQDLSIGKMKGNMFTCTKIMGKSSGAVTLDRAEVVIYENGIRITGGPFTQNFDIHKSQIINIRHSDNAETIHTDRSVVGRAVTGGLLFGPLGAVIGGMSGLKTDVKNKQHDYLTISFWDTQSKLPQTISVESSKAGIDLFISEFR